MAVLLIFCYNYALKEGIRILWRRLRISFMDKNLGIITDESACDASRAARFGTDLHRCPGTCGCVSRWRAILAKHSAQSCCHQDNTAIESEAQSCRRISRLLPLLKLHVCSHSSHTHPCGKVGVSTIRHIRSVQKCLNRVKLNIVSDSRS